MNKKILDIFYGSGENKPKNRKKSMMKRSVKKINEELPPINKTPIPIQNKLNDIKNSKTPSKTLVKNKVNSNKNINKQINNIKINNIKVMKEKEIHVEKEQNNEVNKNKEKTKDKDNIYINSINTFRLPKEFYDISYDGTK